MTQSVAGEKALGLASAIEDRFRESLPAVIPEMIGPHYPERMWDYFVGHERFFGTLFAPYLAELLDFHDEQKIVEIGEAFLFSRAFTIVQDKVLDEKNGGMTEILLSPLLAAECLYRFKEVTDGLMKYQEMADILRDAAVANYREKSRHCRRVLGYGLEDLSDLTRKTGVVRLPAMAICQSAGRKDDLECVLQIVESILLAIQLCDDMADMVDDFYRGNYTLPITLSLIGEDGEERISWGRAIACFLTQNQYARLLPDVTTGLKRGAVEEVFDLVLENLQSAYSMAVRINDRSENMVSCYAQCLTERVKMVRKVYRDFCQCRNDLIWHLFADLEPAKIALRAIGAL